MPNYIAFHIEKRSDIGPGLEAHLTRLNYTPDNADKSLSHLNKILIPLNGMTVNDIVLSRIQAAGISVRRGQNLAMEVVFSGSHEAMDSLSETQLASWTDDTLAWAKKEWGEENVVAAFLHRDEMTPHLHLVFTPIVSGESRRSKSYHDKCGGESERRKYEIDHQRLRLCANDVLTKANLYGYWDRYAYEVGSKYGLERGEHAEPGSKKSHLSSTEYNRELSRTNKELEAQIEELQQARSELIAKDRDLRAQIAADNRKLEFKAEHAKLPQPNILGMYGKEDVERLLADRDGGGIVTRRKVVDDKERIAKLETRIKELELTVEEQSDILSNPARLRSRADFIEKKESLRRKLDAVYRTHGKVRLLGKMDGTNLDIALYSYRGGTRVDIILTTPQNDLYAVPFDSKVGVDGMSEVATFAKSRTASPNSRVGSVLAKTIRLADLVMARHASSRGGSWSGKSDLSDTEKQALSDAGRSGTLNATLVDTRYVEHIG